MESIALPKRALCVASHVVSGYVGNRASVFPLQTLGFDVDFINSVQFSNHTGYPTVKGQVLNGGQLEELAGGLDANGLLDYDFLLTGYIGSESFLSSVMKLLDAIQAVNPNMRYICDPVLGDDGKYYVPQPMLELFRTVVVPRAHTITPNQFEAELLSGVKIASEPDIRRCIEMLHSMGPKVVVISSSELAEHPGRLCSFISEVVTDTAGTVSHSSHEHGATDTDGTVFTSVAKGKNHNRVLKVTRVITQKLSSSAPLIELESKLKPPQPAGGDSDRQVQGVKGLTMTAAPKFTFTGTGDCLAALVLAWHSRLGDGHGREVLLNVQMTMQSMMRVTLQTMTLKIKKYLKDRAASAEMAIANSDGAPSNRMGSLVAHWGELCVVQSKRFIEDPKLFTSLPPVPVPVPGVTDSCGGDDLGLPCESWTWDWY
jgi:pyridoxal kinase